MWQAILLQILTCGVVGASLFLKSSPDFGWSTSYALAAVAVISSVVSVVIFRQQQKDNQYLRRCLDNIIRSITLNEFVYGAIRSSFSKAAPADYPLMQSLSYGEGLHFFSFWSEDERDRGGLVMVQKDQMNRFSMFDESDLNGEVLSFTKEVPPEIFRITGI
jgi:hypothetical protein